MIILDTSIFAAAMKPQPDAAAVAWLDRQPGASLYLCAPVLMEVLLGIALLPSGGRKKFMISAIENLAAHYFAERVLAFDSDAAAMYAPLAIRSARRGCVLSVTDCQIAAIAAIHECAVATRDTAPFQAAGIRVINPWKS